MRRGASVPQRRRSTLYWNVLSFVRKNRNSSGGLYRCRRRSAHDRHRTNAMRFLMKTLRAHPIPRLMHAFRQNPLWIRWALAAVFVSSVKTRSRHPSLLGSRNLQLSIFWRQFNPASQSCGHGIYASENPSRPSSAPHRKRYFSQAVSNVRDRLRPTIE